MIDQATIEQIRNAANIVDVVGDYVSLHRAGANYKGLCPFHNERTPSFIVSPAKNFCHCFGCGKGGDPIGFLKEINNYTYREALMHLANKYHIEVKEVDVSSEELAERQKRQVYFTLCDYARKHYDRCLSGDDEQAIAHLNSLGIREASIERFRIGYADDVPNSLATAISNGGFSIAHATDLGLVAPINGGINDIINHAIVLPIINKTGKVTAFAWQDIDQPQSPFCVTMRSAIFNAQEAVFGIFQANHAISKAKSCYVVDTPYDAIMMNQNGLENTIAPLGNTIDRYTLNDITKCVKDDSATIITADISPAALQRTFRIIDQLVSQGISVFAINVPQSIHKEISLSSASAWAQRIEGEKLDAITWKATLLLEQAQSSTERIKAIHSTLRTIKVMRDEASKRIYLNVLSQITKFPPETLGMEMEKLK